MFLQPSFSRPSDEELKQAFDRFGVILKYIPPTCVADVSVIVRALMHLGISLATAMWTVYDLCVTHAIMHFYVDGAPDDKVRFTDENPPAGLELVGGKLILPTIAQGVHWDNVTVEPIHGFWQLYLDMPSPLGIADEKQPATQSDIPHDTQNKPRKKRGMNSAAADCARRYKRERKRDRTISLLEVVTDYVSERGGSVASIIRVLNDHPEQWKDDKKTT